MASTVQHPSRLTIWLYRSLALGSTVAAAMHTAPLVEKASITHAIELSRSKESFLANAGVRRITASAQKGEEKRKRLKEHGALSVLSNCVSCGDEELREAALHAVALLSEGDAAAVVRERGLRDALGSDICGEGCQAIWKAFGLEDMGVGERRLMLEKLQTGG